MLQLLYLVLETSIYIIMYETYCVTPPDAHVDDGTESTESIRGPLILFFVPIVAVGTYFTIHFR